MSGSCDRCARDDVRHRTLPARRYPAAIGRRPARRCAELEDARCPRTGARQRRALPDQLLGTASRPRMAHRSGQDPRPRPMVHRDPGHVRERSLDQSVQQSGLARPRDRLGQRSRARPAARRAMGDRPAPRRLRLVDGRAAGLSLGGPLSGQGRPRGRELRQRPHRDAQPRLPEGPHGRPGSGARASRRRLVLGRAGRRAPRLRPNLRGLGAQPGFYRAGLHESALGAPDLDTFLRTDWEERFARRAAADLYAQLRTWEAGDIAGTSATAAISPWRSRRSRRACS